MVASNSPCSLSVEDLKWPITWQWIGFGLTCYRAFIKVRKVKDILVFIHIPVINMLDGTPMSDGHAKVKWSSPIFKIPRWLDMPKFDGKKCSRQGPRVWITPKPNGLK